jgi:hypothetical protein
MKNRDLELKHYPTPAELYALERAAKEARAVEIARLVDVALGGVKKLFSGAGKARTKGLQHA